MGYHISQVLYEEILLRLKVMREVCIHCASVIFVTCSLDQLQLSDFNNNKNVLHWVIWSKVTKNTKDYNPFCCLGLAWTSGLSANQSHITLPRTLAVLCCDWWIGEGGFLPLKILNLKCKWRGSPDLLRR